MPKRIVKVTYACEICSHEYDQKIDATKCEQSGLAIPEFKRFEVVDFNSLNDASTVKLDSGCSVKIKNRTRAIIQDDFEELLTNMNPHLLPRGYDVWLLTPTGKYKKELFRAQRQYIRKINWDVAVCPLCNSRSIFSLIEKAYHYLGLGHDLPILKDIAHFKCDECGVRFFSTSQSEIVDMGIRQKVRWPIADTRKLIKENQFQY